MSYSGRRILPPQSGVPRGVHLLPVATETAPAVLAVVEGTEPIVIVNGTATATVSVTERIVTKIRMIVLLADAVVPRKGEGPQALLVGTTAIEHEHPLLRMI